MMMTIVILKATLVQLLLSSRPPPTISLLPKIMPQRLKTSDLMLPNIVPPSRATPQLPKITDLPS